MNPAGHHFTNQFLHLVAVLLLFGFLRSFKGNVWLCGFIAAVFAVHPLRVESVAWIAERKDVLGALFWFATLWAYVRYARKQGIVRYLTVLALFSAGLLSKAMLVTLPFILLLVDFWPLERFGRTNKKTVRLLIEKLPLFAISLAVSLFTLHAQQAAMASLSALAPEVRITNAIIAYAVYIRQTLVPLGLAVFYPHPHQMPVAKAVFSMVVLLAITAFVLWNRYKKKYLVTGWFWYVISLVPVIGIVQVGDQAHADRYSYIPSAGLFIALTLFLTEFAHRKTVYRNAFIALAVLALAVFSALTMETVKYWNNDLALFGRAIAVTRDNAPMMVKYADALLARGNDRDAQFWLEKALSIKPSGYAHAVMGAIHQHRDEYDQAIVRYRLALNLEPDVVSTLVNAGAALVAIGNHEEAQRHLQRAIALDPSLVQAYALLGQSYCAIGMVDSGAALIKQAQARDPFDASHYNVLGIVYTENSRFTEAAEQFKKSVRRKKDPYTFSNLAACLAAAGQKKEAVDAYTEALALSPDNHAIRFDLANVLAGMGESAQALELLHQIRAAQPEDTVVLNAIKGLSGK
ncbi:MAG: tetratricopeptide repeat protein [Chitinispirillaceae bacterium]|nr:tetratricopeptide repeat protein [Chitinispirillaceae bacterium]